MKEVEDFLASLPDVVTKSCELEVPLQGPTKEGITTDSNVQYVVQGGFASDDFIFQGSDIVLSNVLSNEILHAQIREQGGAYGAGYVMNSMGDIGTYSYRDPHLKRTLEIEQKLGETLKQLELTQEEVDQYIIGSLTHFQFPIVPQAVNDMMLRRHYREETPAILEQRLQEALETTPQTLHQRHELITDALQQGYMVTIGNRDHIQKESNAFDRMRALK